MELTTTNYNIFPPQINMYEMLSSVMCSIQKCLYHAFVFSALWSKCDQFDLIVNYTRGLITYFHSTRKPLKVLLPYFQTY